tara:strand:- start:1506 stop:1760 length:255 start_codon:yes stop_codon:yes gene_type:complete
MALNKGKLTRELTALFTPDTSKASANLTPKQVAEKLATIIDDYIKSADITVKVDPGIVVATAGTAAAQTGKTTGPGIGKSISIK